MASCLSANRRRFCIAAMACIVGMFSPAVADIRLDGGSLAALLDGVTAHESVKSVADGDGRALLLSEGGFTVPTAGNLTAASGSIDLRCRVPDPWPVDEDRALFHLGEQAHIHVTILFRKGILMAVYKGGEAYFASTRYRQASEWKPGSWHRVQFSWRSIGRDVDFLLTVDGRLVDTALGRLIEDWPATCTVGVRGTRTPWQGMLNDIALSTRTFLPPELAPGTRTITVQADKELGECYPFWTVGNCNKPQLFLDPAYVKRMGPSRPFMKQVNAVYLLGGRYTDKNCWYLGMGEDGRIRTDFTGMVAQLKAVLDVGYVPWVVLDNVPYNMSDPPQENTYGNTAPPKDERIWGQYVEAAVRAMVEGIGRETVGTWWFRVGTEPDLCPAHWAGTREQYFAHYDTTVEAVGRVLPEAKIGPGNILNPAGGEFGNPTRKQWGLDIIDHAGAGTNTCTGTRGTRMDWFSFSWYGRVGQPLRAFDSAVTAIRDRLKPYPQFADMPLVVGEFAVLHDERGRRLWGGDTTEWAASFYAALADRVYGYDIKQVYEWSETTCDVLHPRARVIEMLQGMVGGRRVAVDVQAESANSCGAIACRKGQDLIVLLYNHHFMRRPKVRETVHMTIRDPGMKAREKWVISEQVIDAEHGVWAYAFDADCAAAGLTPLPTAGSYEGAVTLHYGDRAVKVLWPKREEYAKMAAVHMLRDREPLPVSDGGVTLDFDLPGHSVRLLRLSPAP
ncbi:MAG: hypothetical protein AB1696_23040 [Planctomycetota bacterium]